MAYHFETLDDWHHPAPFPLSIDPAPADMSSPSNVAPAYPFIDHQQRRASVPASSTATFHHRQPAPAYHPYANSPRYQPQQRPSPVHRSSPLSQQQQQQQSSYSGMVVADDFVDTSVYTGQYRDYNSNNSRTRQQQHLQPGFQQPFDQQSLDQQRRHSTGYYESPAVEQRYRTSSATYPSPPPPHPQLQHLQHVQIPMFPAGHGPRSASSSSSSTSSHATSASASTSTSATSSGSSYVPGTADMMANSGVMCVPDLNLGMGMGIEGMDVEMEMGVDVDALEMEMGMGMGMGMDLGYIQQTQQQQQPPPQHLQQQQPPQQQHSHQQQSPIVASGGVSMSNISPQMVMHQHHLMYDDEPSPLDVYAEYAATNTGDVDSYGLDASVHQQQQHQQHQEQLQAQLHQQQMQLQLQHQQQIHQQEGVVGVVQEWQREGREYDSADSDSESEAGDHRRTKGRTAKESEAQVSGEQQHMDSFAVSENSPSISSIPIATSTSNGTSTSTTADNSSGHSSDSGSDSGSDAESDNSDAGADQDITVHYSTQDEAATSTASATKTSNFVSSLSAPAAPASGTISKRASTRTITPARTRSTAVGKGGRGRRGGGARSRASTQTLTQKSVAAIVADTDPDADAEGEDDLGEGEEVVVMGSDQDAVGEVEEDEEKKENDVEEDEDDEDDEMTDESSYDYDDEKDGEFVLRSRSRSSRPSARSSTRRGMDEGGALASAKRAGGRSLRTRKSSSTTTGGLSTRYNPYSLYAANASAAAVADGMVMSMGSPTTATTHSNVITSSIPGLRTLSASLAINTSFGGSDIDSTGFNSPISPTLSSHSSSLSQHSHSRSATGSSSASSTTSSSLSLMGNRHRRPRPTTNLPVPVPVPNLTKKSRGRRVPTVSSLEELRKVASGLSQDASSNGGTRGSGRKTRGGGGAAGAGAAGGAKGSRMYLCDVEGCGKCFARGEHLKRHVRSIHTNEKPHTCPYPGCGKEFSRHDNLGQHMRVHKDFVPPPSSVKA